MIEKLTAAGALLPIHRPAFPPRVPAGRRTLAVLASSLCLAWLAAVGAHAEENSAASGDANAGAAVDPGYIDPGYLLVKDLLSENGKTRRQAVKQLIEGGDRSLAFGIVDALFFISRLNRIDAVKALQGLTGEKAGAKYWEWVEIAGRLGEEIRPKPGYDAWKGVLFQRIDRGYEQMLYPGAPRTIRLEEVVSGGVPIEGIPSVDDPSMVTAAEARYLDDEEEIFGVVLGGEARAYPLRILDWHEMLNDTIGGEPVTLSYCTLCGSGVLFHTRKEDGSSWRFGTSGLLYRSNKLMFDRETRTLWSNLKGEPVFGKLVGQGLKLDLIPHTRTTWGEWKRRHPDTLAVEIDDELERLG
ncbi:MAG: DUF3179 domain-containing protein, partial [Holophagales bacterium]|nr:DUF3179 domain-containing protein [Holophagales bacterium]